MNLVDLFAGTEGYTNVGKIAIVGESWGADEARVGQPFVGLSGMELTKMLADAGLSRTDCFITNVCSRRPPDNDMKFFFNSTKAARSNGELPLRGLFPDEQTKLDLARLHQQLAFNKPKVIIAFGNYALWALTESNFSIKAEKGWKVPTGITNWRGSYLEWNTWDADSIDPELHIPVIPTFHPAAILRNWPWRTPAVHDIRQRAAKIAAGFAVPKPEYRFITKPTIEQALATLDLIIKLPSGSFVTCDVETIHDQLACVGFGWSKHDAICIPFIAESKGGSYWSPEEEIQLRYKLEELFACEHLAFSNQNFNFDRQYIRKYLFVDVKVKFDTMTAQHVCWPGTPKNLAYLSSLYCAYHIYWKWMKDAENAKPDS